MQQLNEIYEIVNFIDSELYRASLFYNEYSLDKFITLYTMIQKVKKEFFKILPEKDTIEYYSYIKFKILENEINIKIMIKEKLGMDTTNDYVEMKELIA